MNADAQTKALSGEAPWFYLPAVIAEDFPWERYTDDDGEFLGIVPVGALSNQGWRH